MFFDSSLGNSQFFGNLIVGQKLVAAHPEYLPSLVRHLCHGIVHDFLYFLYIVFRLNIVLGFPGGGGFSAFP